jgi:hypothetical protein
MPKIELHLLLKPALGGRVKRDRQPNRHLRADPSASVQDCRERIPTYIQGRGRIGDRKIQGREAELTQDLARMRGSVHTHGLHQW